MSRNRVRPDHRVRLELLGRKASKAWLDPLDRRVQREIPVRKVLRDQKRSKGLLNYVSWSAKK